ncbi:MAG: hypothetical protein QOJ07_3039 [Thermoleophilaceae bacterium]|nr:hypothetical protein [Thermoleophilaceae bacterium]
MRSASKLLPVLAASTALMASTGAAYGATVREVGPGHTYAKPCQAITAAQAGDTVRIDAAGNGTYDGDVCASSAAGLTIEGYNGRPHIDAAGNNFGGKGTWVLSGADTVVRNVELSGAAVTPDNNGAAIRMQGGGDLTLIGSYIHDNQEGILVDNSPSNVVSDIVVDSSEFARNGTSDGLEHNIYVGHVHSFTMRYSYSHDVTVGHLVKSRADTNDILYNRLTEQAGTGSFELDLPDGGLSHVIGNVIQQGPTGNNSTMLSYGEESTSNPNPQLYVVNNTFVNDRSAGGTAVHDVAGASPASVVDNIKVGPGTFVDQVSATLTSNCLPDDARFVAPASFDYHLQESSPCRDAGTPPAAGLAPDQQYVYDTGHQARSVVGSAPDAGAFEWAPPAPADSDGDGVPDSTDACPAQSDTGSPRSPRNGCPADSTPAPDSDGDGVPDATDQCSGQAGPPPSGCPLPGSGATDGNDTLTGDASANVICGLLGNDTLSGLGGNDTLWGDRCNDKLKSVTGAAAKDGNDKLSGGDGNDKLYGAGGNDVLSGGKGNDKLYGGGGNDKLTGGPGVNTYSGGAGNDTLNAQNGKKETVDCGPGKKDKATVDKHDKVKGCEKVKRAKK